MTFVTQKPAFFYHKKLHQVRVILAHNAQVEVSIPQQWAMLQGRRRTRPMRRMSDSKGVQNGGFYTWGYPQIIWLVVWLPFFTFPYIGLLIIPTDVHIFQRGGPTTNQMGLVNVFLLWICFTSSSKICWR